MRHIDSVSAAGSATTSMTFSDDQSISEEESISESTAERYIIPPGIHDVHSRHGITTSDGWTDSRRGVMSSLFDPDNVVDRDFL